MDTLEVANLTKQFGSLVAVDDVSFTIDSQGTYSIIGPNGAGKTTLFNLLKGTYQPNGGRITIGDEEINGSKPAETTHLGITRAFQQARGFPEMSVLDNMLVGFHTTRETSGIRDLLPVERRKTERERLREKAQELLEFVGINVDMDTPFSSLPYAHRKLCSISMALATDPEFLLLDEPVAGMNPSEKQDVLDTLERVQTEYGLTVLMIEHNMSFVVDLSDRIIVMDDGKKIAEGQPENIMTDPAVEKAYFGEAEYNV